MATTIAMLLALLGMIVVYEMMPVATSVMTKKIAAPARFSAKSNRTIC